MQIKYESKTVRKREKNHRLKLVQHVPKNLKEKKRSESNATLCESKKRNKNCFLGFFISQSFIINTCNNKEQEPDTHERARGKEREYNHVVLVQQITKQTSSGFLALFKAVNMHTHTRA